MHTEHERYQAPVTSVELLLKEGEVRNNDTRWRFSDALARHTSIAFLEAFLYEQELRSYLGIYDMPNGAMHYTYEGVAVKNELEIEGDGQIKVEFIKPSKNPEKGFSTSTFFNFVANNHLLPSEREALEVYMKQGGKIVMFEKSPSLAFQEELLAHVGANQFNIAPLAECLIAYQGMLEIENSNGHTHIEETDRVQSEEVMSLRQLIKDSTETLKFAAITPASCMGEEANKDQISQEIKDIVRKLNRESDPYEFAYNVFTTVGKAQRKQTYIALGMLAVSVAAPTALGVIAERTGPFSERVIAQMFGDCVQVGIASLDRVLASVKGLQLHKEDRKEYIQNTLRESVHALQARLRFLLIDGMITGGLSAESLVTHSLEPSFIIGPITSSFITGQEFAERKQHAEQLQLTQETRAIITQYIEQKFPLPAWIRKKVEKHVESSVAALDFAGNTPALLTWLGTMGTCITLSTLKAVCPGIPDAVLLSWSGIGGENLVAGVGGFYKIVKEKPMKKFERMLPLLYTLRTENTDTHQR